MTRAKNTRSDRIPLEEEVLAFFDERIGHYQKMKQMYLDGDFHAYRHRDGHLIFTPKERS